jgi:flagellar biosynthesis/type III secretory pathway protein FliH
MASLSNQARRCSYLRALLFAVALFLLLGSAAAQTQPRPSATPPAPDPIPTNPTKPDSSSPDFGSPESEMRARLILKAEKKQYDENVARAREAAQLATQLVETYEAKKAFGSDDGKKLERLEKLTKRIRNEAGGSDTEPDVKDIPAAMEAAVKRVAELMNDLRKLVEDTPRHVISASVIDQANKLLGLIQHVRDAR